MQRLFLLFLGFLLLAVPVWGQTNGDSTIITPTDSFAPKDNIVSSINASMQIDDSLMLTPEQMLSRHPYFEISAQPAVVYEHKKEFKGKETMFYVLCGFLMIFSMLRLAFGKYFNDLFRVFFRTTLKQRQIKEQLIQAPLPSVAFNVFFIATAGLYLDFLFQYLQLKPVDNFWLLYAYCCGGLSLIYFTKFVCLKVCGWLFSLRVAADSYIFIVFIINKIIGIFLLPVIIILAFSGEPGLSTVFLLSWCGIGLLFLYRFILGYAAIRKEVRFNLFHFFLYLCAFEVAPLLLIYRLLLLVF